MPLYEFYCEKCDDIFEYLVLSKNNTPQCPSCNNTDVVKQFSVFGFTSGGKSVTGSSNSDCSSCSSHNCSSCS